MIKCLSVISLFLFVFSFSGFSKNKSVIHPKIPLSIQYGGPNDTPLIFHITGDGGAVRFDLKMFKEYHNHGFSYIGLNSLKYFGSKKTPDKVAKDMIPVIKSYSDLWNKRTLILVGFSFGSEIIPFLSERLPDDLKKQLKLIVLMTPAKTSDFRIRVRDMIGLDKKNERYSVVEETSKIKSPKVLVIFGSREKPGLIESKEHPNLKVTTIKGGHGFTDSQEIFRMIQSELTNERIKE
jgi:type IV secretory pathway VirJ component